jgi:hypothetical protein
MKRWIGSLHGGQLVMLLLFLGALGLVIAWFAYNVMLISNTQFAAAFEGRVTADPAIEAMARSTSNAAIRYALLAATIWLSGVAALWVWFGARREVRVTVVAESPRN